MGSYSDDVKTINDFRNNLVNLDFDYKCKIRDEEIKIINVLNDLFKIPDEAEISISYEVDKEFCLSSNMRLNVKSEKGFKLIREECHSKYNYNSYFDCVNPEIIYQYYFKM